MRGKRLAGGPHRVGVLLAEFLVNSALQDGYSHSVSFEYHQNPRVNSCLLCLQLQAKQLYPKGPRPLYRIDDLPRGALLVVEGERGMARESILPLPRGRAQAGWEPNPLTKAQKNGTEEDWKVRSGTGENGPVQG